jgi:cell shape-determining protein MreC
MAKKTMKEMLEMIDAKIEHIEDITADNRAIIVKLVKQNNSIVEYLKQIEIEIVDDGYGSETSFLNTSLTSEEEEDKLQKYQDMKEMLSSLFRKQEELKELEEELQKHKDKLTPGQMGIS